MDFIQINHAHDLFFRESLEHRDIVIGIAVCTLPEKILFQINFDSIELVNDIWVDSELTIHYADILYRARHKRVNCWVYLLFEHKSSIDSNVPFQNYQYLSQIWEEYRKQHSRSKLPAILPIIIYHGLKTWTVINSMMPLIEILEGAESCIPEYKNIILDLSAVASVDEFCCKKNRIRELSVEVPGFFKALKYSRSHDVLEQVSKIIRMFNGKGPKSQAYLSTLLTYIGAVLPEKRRTEFLEIISSNHEAGDTFMRSVAESLQYEGWIKGKKEGREEKAREDETTIKEKDVKIKEKDTEIKEKDVKIGELDAKMKAIVRNLLSREMSTSEIHRITGLSVYKIRKIKSNLR